MQTFVKLFLLSKKNIQRNNPDFVIQMFFTIFLESKILINLINLVYYLALATGCKNVPQDELLILQWEHSLTMDVMYTLILPVPCDHDVEIYTHNLQIHSINVQL